MQEKREKRDNIQSEIVKLDEEIDQLNAEVVEMRREKEGREANQASRASQSSNVPVPSHQEIPTSSGLSKDQDMTWAQRIGESASESSQSGNPPFHTL